MIFVFLKIISLLLCRRYQLVESFCHRLACSNTHGHPSFQPSQVASHPPALGEHTAEVLRELGYAAADIERLAQQGIV